MPGTDRVPDQKQLDEIRRSLLPDLRGLVRDLAPDAVGGWLEMAAAQITTVLVSGPVGSGKTDQSRVQ